MQDAGANGGYYPEPSAETLAAAQEIIYEHRAGGIDKATRDRRLTELITREAEREAELERRTAALVKGGIERSS